MAFGEYLVFENPEIMVFLVGLITFLVSFEVLKIFIAHRGSVFIFSLAIALIGTWRLYNENFYGREDLLAIVLGLAVLVIISKIILSFFRKSKKEVGVFNAFHNR